MLNLAAPVLATLAAFAADDGFIRPSTECGALEASASGGALSVEFARLAWQEGLAELDDAARRTPDAGAPGGPGLALFASKVLTCELEGAGYVDNGVVLVEDGKIVATGRRADVEVPEDYVRVECGRNWLMPGMVDLHSHSTGERGFNDAVLLANPGLRISATILPGNPDMRAALCCGVTTVLFIPGSGTTIGGQGALVKTAPGPFEERVLRDPASLKVAQYGNPDRWGPGQGKTVLNYTLRAALDRGRGYWKAWKAFEEGTGPEPSVDPSLEVYRKLFEGEIPASVHTQWLQVVVATIDILKRQYHLDVFIDHGTFDSWIAAAYAFENGVNAIIGPRNVSYPDRPMIDWSGDNPESVKGSAAGFWEGGHRMIGFNTDSPFAVPLQDLFLQAAIAVRHGFPDDRMQTVRGLTIIPAMTIGFGDRVGSLEPGKDADIVLVSGHPADPRSKVRGVWVDGVKQYDEKEESKKRKLERTDEL
ncbi:MAG: amidohydrolase family protein [Planctomycetota bacterium]